MVLNYTFWCRRRGECTSRHVSYESFLEFLDCRLMRIGTGRCSPPLCSLSQLCLGPLDLKTKETGNSRECTRSFAKMLNTSTSLSARQWSHGWEQHGSAKFTASFTHLHTMLKKFSVLPKGASSRGRGHCLRWFEERLCGNESDFPVLYSKSVV